MTASQQAAATLAQIVGRLIDELGAAAPADLLAWRRTNAPAEQFIDVSDGVMVAFYPSSQLARQLAIDGGEPPEDLHITLALPGKLSELSPAQRKRLPVIVRGFAMISRPLVGTISGLTEFPAHDGKKPVVYLVDVPGLPAWRQRLVEILALNGYTVANDHGFVPHMTLKYAEPNEPIAASHSDATLTFDSLCLVLGGVRQEFPLGGNPDVDESLETFGRGPGRPRKEQAAVDQYQRDLEDEYNEWADEAAAKLAAAQGRAERETLLAALLLVLFGRLQQLGREELPNAATVALGDKTIPPELYAKISQVLTSNDAYLKDSLVADLRARLVQMINSREFQEALLADTAQARQLLLDDMETFLYRVSQYAGAWWLLYNWSVGAFAQDDRRPVTAHLDPQAHHCSECPLYHSEAGEEYDSFESYLGATGNRVPGEFECGNGCRCWLTFGAPRDIVSTGKIGV